MLQEDIKLGFVLDEPGISTSELRLSLCEKSHLSYYEQNRFVGLFVTLNKFSCGLYVTVLLGCMTVYVTNFFCEMS